MSSSYYESLDADAKTMVIDLWLDDDEIGADGLDYRRVSVPLAWTKCLRCDGTGSHVNPSIDGNGLSTRDFEEDPDFCSDYKSGVFDVSCYDCDGRGEDAEPNYPEMGESLAKQVKEHIRAYYENEAESAACAAAERRAGC